MWKYGQTIACFTGMFELKVDPQSHFFKLHLLFNIPCLEIGHCISPNYDHVTKKFSSPDRPVVELWYEPHILVFWIVPIFWFLAMRPVNRVFHTTFSQFVSIVFFIFTRYSLVQKLLFDRIVFPDFIWYFLSTWRQLNFDPEHHIIWSICLQLKSKNFWIFLWN